VLPTLAFGSPLPEEPAAAEELPPKLWSNSTDLSLILTDGNSESEAFGFRSRTLRSSERSVFRITLQANRAESSDDPIRRVDPGFTWPVGAPPPADLTTTRAAPSTSLDVERYFFESRYERSVSGTPGESSARTFLWHVGGSWESNRDAGIVSRTIIFGGLGHSWWSRDDLQFGTQYGLSWTDRREDQVDPLKSETFPGWRFSWDYLNRWGRNTIFESDWIVNGNIDELDDYSSSMINSIAVSMNERLALKVSLQWLYNSKPALQDVGVTAEVDLVDPDGIPGTGDEFFRTVDGGGASIDVGTVSERKERLDTVFSVSLVVNF
jgi:hypothetical protein